MDLFLDSCLPFTHNIHIVIALPFPPTLTILWGEEWMPVPKSSNQFLWMRLNLNLGILVSAPNYANHVKRKPQIKQLLSLYSWTDSCPMKWKAERLFKIMEIIVLGVPGFNTLYESSRFNDGARSSLADEPKTMIIKKSERLWHWLCQFLESEIPLIFLEEACWVEFRPLKLEENRTMKE